MDRRKYPRYPDKEVVGLYTFEEKRFTGQGILRNVGVKGCCFEMDEPPLEASQKIHIVFGFKRGRRVEIPGQVVAKYVKNGHQAYSAKFIETDIVKLNIIRDYIEEIRVGKI
ncbi:MAG: PilZ domain-containing protein [bacterium]|nr:PilZ domain-containing protein [bacterium]